MIEIRDLTLDNTELLADVQKWWTQREGVDFNVEILSDYGFMAFSVQSSRPIAALWLYPIMGSKVAWMGWPIADPESGRLERSIALDQLLDKVKETAQEMGYTRIWTTSGVPPVKARLEKHGYLRGDTNIDQYWGLI